MRRQNLILMSIVLLAASCTGAAGPIATFGTTATTISSSTTTTSTPTSEPVTTKQTATPGMLLVLGDWGSGTAPQGAVAGAMARFAEENDVDAILTTGDNFYSDDAEFLMKPFDWVDDADINWWVTWGNHDLESTTRQRAVSDTFGSPPRWTTHDWGNVTVVILDSNQVEKADQIEFLKMALAEIDGPTIVVFHHPAYSCSRHGDSDAVQREWLPEFDSDVVLVLSGHDHNYQRIDEGGLTYVVSGGGGRRLYDLEPCDSDTKASAELHHFVVLQQNDQVIHGTAVDVNGTPIDEFFIDLEPGVLSD